MSMHRRQFLVTGLAATAYGALGAPVPSAAAPTTPLWDEFVRSPDNHPQIPNVAYAGYRTGDRPLPRPWVVANVRDFGARPDGTVDSTDAINRAIAAAGRCGGGAVFVPAGTYRIDGIVQVGYDNVVLRGAGSGRTTLRCTRSLTEIIGPWGSPYGGDKSAWSWTGGLVWVCPAGRFRDQVAGIRAGGFPAEGWIGDDLLGRITADAPRGARTLLVDSARGLRSGQRVLLKLQNDAAYGLYQHISGDIPGAASYNWADRAKLNGYPFVWPVRIVAVRGRRITLAQPLPVAVRTVWSPRLTTVGPVVRDAGVEHLTIELPSRPQPRHLYDTGFNGLLFQLAWDCWARDVVVSDADNGILMTSAKGVTLTGTRVRGRGRHHSYTCRVQSHDNLNTGFVIEKSTVPVAPGSVHHGINVEILSCGNVWADGVMENGTFDTHRALPFGNVRTAIVVNNDGLHGGDYAAGPLYGGRFAHWNVTITNERAGCIRLDQVAPASATVGISPCRDFGQVDNPDFTGELNSRLESFGTTDIRPANLYTAQLRLRRHRG